jgi:hypothetical protein
MDALDLEQDVPADASGKLNHEIRQDRDPNPAVISPMQGHAHLRPLRWIMKNPDQDCNRYRNLD